MIDKSPVSIRNIAMRRNREPCKYLKAANYCCKAIHLMMLAGVL